MIFLLVHTRSDPKILSPAVFGAVTRESLDASGSILGWTSVLHAQILDIPFHFHGTGCYTDTRRRRDHQLLRVWYVTLNYKYIETLTQLILIFEADLQASPQTPNRGDHEIRTLTLCQPCGLLKESMKKWFKLLYLWALLTRLNWLKFVSFTAAILSISCNIRRQNEANVDLEKLPH